VITLRSTRIGLAATLVVLLLVGVAIVSAGQLRRHNRITIVGYFANANGIFVGDDVRILGVPVGRIDTIQPQPDRVKITFWFDAKYRVPASAVAAILSPSLVTARTIQLTPAYTNGPTMADGAVIPLQRTAVPVEWDDFRTQLQKLTEYLQPTQPGGVSTTGAMINTTADVLRGEGPDIRDTILKMSQAFSALGDHSGDIFSTIKNLSVFVAALQSSGDLLAQLNTNLAAVSAVLTDDDGAVGQAITDLNNAATDATSFVADNRESIGTFSDKLTAVTSALAESLDDIKQTLHLGPTAFQNFVNTYHAAHGAMTGGMMVNNFADPITFLCGGIEAASRLGAEQSAKLCAQYLAPIIKNRQYNFPPLAFGPFAGLPFGGLPFGPALVGAQARPNEVTYSEDWLRPDYRPTPPATGAADTATPQPTPDAPLAAEAPPPPPAQPTDPAAGLPGMMMPPGAGS
jgi:phospholipid/cholesterol/gamma-HCH transport system substrate-binding protein